MVPALHCCLAQTDFRQNAALSAARIDQPFLVTDVGSLLKNLEERSGIRLVCDSRCKSLKIVARFLGKSPATVMEAIATLVAGEWEAAGAGYRLNLSPQSVRERAEWWRAFDAEWSLARQSRRRAFLETTEPFWKDLPAQVLQAAFDALNDGYLRQLHLGGFPTIREGGVAVEPETLEREARQLLEASARQHNADFDLAQSDVVLLINNGMSFDAMSYQKDGRIYDLGTSAKSSLEEFRFYFPLDQSRVPTYVEGLKEKPRKNLATLAGYQKATVWETDADAIARRFSFDPHAGKAPPPSVLAAFTNRARRWRLLAERFPVDFLADYHASPILLNPPGADMPAESDFGAALTQFRDREDVSMRVTEAKLLLVRDNRWYRDDALEVPLPVANALIARLYRGDYARFEKLKDIRIELRAFLDAASEALETLSPWQVANGLAYYVDETRFEPLQPLAPLADLLLRYPKTCALYRELTTGQRDALLGDGLPVAALGGRELGLLHAAFPGVSADVRVRLVHTDTGVRLVTGITPSTHLDRLELLTVRSR